MTRRHVVDGLKRLLSLDLIRLERTNSQRPGFGRWTLLSEDGTGAPFTVPTSGLAVPVSFWTQGWAAVLTPSEILAYLMVRQLATQYSGKHVELGVGLPPARREQWFGVTKSTYATLNELEEFGLLKRTSNTQEQPQGEGAQPRDVDRFRLDDRGLRVDAYRTVTSALRSPATYRIGRYRTGAQAPATQQ